jgi:hypothetical protein
VGKSFGSCATDEAACLVRGVSPDAASDSRSIYGRRHYTEVGVIRSAVWEAPARLGSRIAARFERVGFNQEMAERHGQIMRVPHFDQSSAVSARRGATKPARRVCPFPGKWLQLNRFHGRSEWCDESRPTAATILSRLSRPHDRDNQARRAANLPDRHRRSGVAPRRIPSTVSTPG